MVIQSKYFPALVAMIAGLAFGLSAAEIPAPHKFPVTEGGYVKAWIYFSDKPAASGASLQKARQILTERSVQRRLKVKELGNVINFSDMPVESRYIEQIQPYISRLRACSRWFNAVSVETDYNLLKEIRQFSFVRDIKPVYVFRRAAEVETEIPFEQKKPHLSKTITDSLDYGDSGWQLGMLKVPALHQLGYYGEGVLIGMLDDGFNLVYLHKAFKHLDIAATHDFIHGDEAVDDGGMQTSVGGHGTKTLSVIGGYYPGYLIGPAFKASYLLAKTEVAGSETQIEEDFWVAGLEWCDSLGADIVSSSLGYIDWYTWQDMDGQTAVTTIAADMAVDKGMLVFNSAGNEYDNTEHNTLIAPADGFKVMAIGAVDRYGLRSPFSSVGPTADGRVKPDLAAMGSSVVMASSGDTARITTGNGTSFACPLAAGCAALLLSIYPDLTPEQVHMSLRSTASQYFLPDTRLGWGIIDIEKAQFFADTSDFGGIGEELPDFLTVQQNRPNPFNATTDFVFQVRNPSLVEIVIFNVLGQKIFSLGTKYHPSRIPQTVTLNDALSHELASGMYLFRVTAVDLTTSRMHVRTKKMLYIK